MARSGPSRWLDAMVGACVAILVGAMALYGAVRILSSIWLQLCIALSVAAVVGIATVIVVRWWRRW